MAYTTQQAVVTLNGYLSIESKKDTLMIQKTEDLL